MSEIFADPTWAVVELMGRQIIAGLVSGVMIAGTEMLRVDVPPVIDADRGDISGYTKFFGGGAIYAVTPVDERGARIVVLALRRRPVEEYVSANRVFAMSEVRDELEGFPFDLDEE